MSGRAETYDRAEVAREAARTKQTLRSLEQNGSSDAIDTLDLSVGKFSVRQIGARAPLLSRTDQFESTLIESN